MSSIWTRNLSLSIFGEAEGPAIGVVMDNLPPGEYIDLEELRTFLSRRFYGTDVEVALPQVLSGLLNDKTTGVPLCAFISNHKGTNTIEREKLNQLNRLPRPGHADYTGTLRYRGFQDLRDAGHQSEKMTIPLCFAGAVSAQILERRGIYVGAHIASLHGIQDTMFSRTKVNKNDILSVRQKEFPVVSDSVGEQMLEEIDAAVNGGESLGGMIECAAINVPAGIGSPIFDGLQNTIAQLLFGIPGVCGVEFGAGFQVSEMVGSQNNDTFYVDKNGHIKTKTNNHGGIIGGISSGMPITLNVAVKPSATINKKQETINLQSKKKEVLEADSKFIPTIVPMTVPCIEAVVNIAILSHMMEYPNF